VDPRSLSSDPAGVVVPSRAGATCEHTLVSSRVVDGAAGVDGSSGETLRRAKDVRTQAGMT
jgi:hypothetical protein